MSIPLEIGYKRLYQRYNLIGTLNFGDQNGIYPT